MVLQEELHLCPPDKRVLQAASCILQISGWWWWLQVKLLDWQHGCIQVGKKVSCHDCWGRSAVLVIQPDEEDENSQTLLDISAMRLEGLQRPAYAKRLFVNLLKIHQNNHCFFNCARDQHSNAAWELWKMFTEVCPHCVKVLSMRKPVAGIKNIVTDGFGVHGQVDIINSRVCPMAYSSSSWIIMIMEWRSWCQSQFQPSKPQVLLLYF